MASDRSRTQAQLDKAEREHLEQVVAEMRERVEANVEFQIEQRGLDEDPDTLDDQSRRLREAIELEGDDWADAVDQFVTGAGYTVVNRLAALRCMEVRGFLEEEVTVFTDGGLTPAAETLVHEEFLLEDEAILQAYRDACDDLESEVEVLFDRSSAYGQVDPDVDAFEDACRMLDRVSDDAWRADDVLGWVYEYYNHEQLPELRRKAHSQGLDPADVPAANQFYTPHWVVRLLTDNSLGKIYSERPQTAAEIHRAQEQLSVDDRTGRSPRFDESPDVASLCTYMVDEGDGEATAFDHPSEIRVIDPACGSGHFLLYAFDVLERIWHAETDVGAAEIPAKILEHNVYGVDIDLRACQLAAFNLYLKARKRAESAGAEDFQLPRVGIVCSDARIVDVDAASDVFDEVAGDQPAVREALEQLLVEFQDVHGLGSLLDVRGTLSDEFLRAQTKLSDSWRGTRSLQRFLEQLRDAVAERHDDDSFLARDLRSFLRLLVILSREYDVALMNPPYGSGNRMPDAVTEYVEDHYEYGPEYYINFFEACERLTKPNGRIGMIVQRSFMYKQSFEDFRTDFVGPRGRFDFLTEFGNGVLDNATVRTAGTVVRTDAGERADDPGVFFRLHDLDASEKEEGFARAAFGDGSADGVRRKYVRDLEAFSMIPGSPLSYWVPTPLRRLYEADTVFDADNAGLDRDSVGVVKEGLTSGNNDRFLRRFWEVDGAGWRPFAKGGEDAWTLPHLNLVIDWRGEGERVRRYSGSYVRNEEYYGSEALTYTYLKEGGRRFGYLNEGSVFGHAGKIFVPDGDVWPLLAYANSSLVTYLMVGQTPERHWEVGNVAKLPWLPAVADAEGVDSQSRTVLANLLALRSNDPASPYYRGPRLVTTLGETETLPWHDHSYRDVFDGVSMPDPAGDVDADSSIRELAAAAREYEAARRDEAERAYVDLDREILDAVDVRDDRRTALFREIELRTGEDPTTVFEDGSVDTDPVELVEELLLHASLTAVSEHTILPVGGEGDESPTLLDAVVDEFEHLFGDRAEDRLVEVDRLLGAESAERRPYPNIANWLRQDLFEYQVRRLERRPVAWRITTRRLVSDPHVEGFGCFIDYRALDSSTFDRLQNEFLDPRKAALRERRNASAQRRTDEALSTAAQTEATAAHERCVNALQQIEQFEARVQDLLAEQPRDWTADDRALATDLGDRVAAFRATTEAKLECYDRLLERNDRAWLEETFSASALETLRRNRTAWIAALEDLEAACEAYAQPPDEPVEAHLYDLFTYFGESLVGSVWPTSTGVLSIGYYPKKRADELLDADGDPKADLVDEDAELLAQIAANFDDYEALAEEIKSGCERMATRIDADWEARALSEVVTRGYRPKQEHGVAVNLTPLAEAELVPESVEDSVL